MAEQRRKTPGEWNPREKAYRPHRTGSNNIQGWGTTADNLKAFLTQRKLNAYSLIVREVVPPTTMRRITSGDWIGYIKTWHEIAEHFGACVSEIVEPDKFRERAAELARSEGWTEPEPQAGKPRKESGAGKEGAK